jgi:hypothetical protein
MPILVQQLSQMGDHRFIWSSESSLFGQSTQPPEIPYVVQSMKEND